MHSSALIAPIRYSAAMKRALSGLASHGSTSVIKEGWMIALPTSSAWASTNRKYNRSQIGSFTAQPEPCRLVGHQRLVELLERWRGRLELLAGRQRARCPFANPCLVVAGQHTVGGAIGLGIFAKQQRAGDIAFVAEQLVQLLAGEW